MNDSRDIDRPNPPARYGRGHMRLAGMALRNGVLVIGPSHWAAAVRTEDGRIVSTSRPRPSVGGGVDRYPVLRGPVRLTEMLLVLPALRRALPEARLALESPRLIATSVLGSIATRALRKRIPHVMAAELAGSAVSLVLVLAALRSGELGQYHGAEHKAIGGYELGIAAADATREHERCGTHLAIPMLATNALAIEGARLLFPHQPTLGRLLGLGVGVAASTELARATQQHSGSRVSRAIAHLGMSLQTHASTREPTSRQLEVAETALAALLAVERKPHAA